MTLNKKTSRRQWLTGSLRWGLLAAFAAISVRLLGRKSAVEEAECIDSDGRTGCRGCLELNACKLPRALSVKQFLKKHNGQRKF